MFNNWFHKKTYPEFWERYMEQNRRRLPGSTPVREATFAVFDTETTGLDPAKDKILSIGGVKVKNYEIEVSETLELYLQQAVAPRQEDIAVHGIVPGVHMRQYTMEESARIFVEWCGDSILVGHHIAFDIAILNRALRESGCDKLRNRSIDTMHLAQRVTGHKPYSTPGNWNLDALSTQYHIPLHDRHTATGDALITAILLLKLLHRLEKRGVTTIGQLLDYRGLF